MLPSFYIENFRLFDQLTIKRLGRVNLIVGRNNAGKSAFLEAALIYVSGASPDVIYRLINSRQEDYDAGINDRSKMQTISLMRHFFKGHRLPSISEPGIIFGTTKNVGVLNIRSAIYFFESSEDRMIRRKLDHDELNELAELDPNQFEECLISEQEGGVTQLLFSPSRDAQGGRLRTSFLRLNSKGTLIQFVSTQGLSDVKSAQLWDAINLTDLEKEVISGLKLVEDKIIGLAFVENEKSGKRIPLIKLQGLEERIPLKSLGDGVTRVLHIILSLVNAKNGVLLIDEFENELHWAVQQSVWEVIFQLAETLNVQVFCTTHSRDCISSFGEVWKKQPDAGAFLRLYNRNNTVLAKEYDVETLSDSLETDVEVR